MLITNKIPASLESAFTNDGIECAPEVLQQPEWSFQSSATTNIVLKLLASGEKLTKVVSRQIYTGVKTGANDAFVINQSVYERIVSLDNSSLGLIKRMAQGEDLRPWYQDDDAKWMIVIPTGFTSSVLGKQLNEDEAWVAFVQQYPGVAQHLDKVRHLAVNRGDKGQYWWELRSCDYYDAFSTSKILWPDISKLPRFSWDESGKYTAAAKFTPTCLSQPCDHLARVKVNSMKCWRYRELF